MSIVHARVAQNKFAQRKQKLVVNICKKLKNRSFEAPQKALPALTS
jgi:hypothetical protein